MEQNQVTQTILLAMGYNLNPTVINAVIEAYELSKEKAVTSILMIIVRLKEGFGEMSIIFNKKYYIFRKYIFYLYK